LLARGAGGGGVGREGNYLNIASQEISREIPLRPFFLFKIIADIYIFIDIDINNGKSAAGLPRE
jgi:hypothetical protein